MDELRTGIKREGEKTVEYKDTVAGMTGGGKLEILATPMMIGAMEGVCARCVAGYLPKGSITVGTHVNVYHKASLKTGEKYKVECELIKIEGKNLIFNVRAYTDEKVIGEGTHTRHIISMRK